MNNEARLQNVEAWPYYMAIMPYIMKTFQELVAFEQQFKRDCLNIPEDLCGCQKRYQEQCGHALLAVLEGLSNAVKSLNPSAVQRLCSCPENP